LNNLAVLADQRGDLDKAEHYHQRALEIHESLAPNSLNLATSLDNMGNLAWQHGDLAKAENYHRRALRIREERAPGSLSVAASLTNLGSDAQARGDLAGAKEFYLRGLAIKEKLAPATLDVANSLNNLGNIAREEGDLAGAERYYRKTLEIREKLAPNSLDVAASLQNLGEAGQDRRNWIEAKDYYQNALRIEQSIAPSGVLAAESLNHLAEVGLALGDVSAAEDYYRQALRIRESVAPGSLAHAESLAGLAAVMRTKGRLDESAQLLAQALDAFENQTGRLGGTEDIRSGFKAKYGYFYLDLIDLLMSQKRAESAFQVLERSRARSLLAMLTAARIDIRKGVDPQLLEMEHRLRETLAAKSSLQIRMRTGPHTEEQVANSRKENEELLARYQQVEEQVRASSPSYAALTQPQPLNMKEVQGLLDKESLLLEYSLGEQHSYVWVVSTNSLASYELPKRAEIEKVARELYELLTARNRIIKDESGLKRQARLAGIQQQYGECAGRLASMILGPVVGYLQAKRLLIVSDGALQYVPFSALPSPVTGGPLVVEHEIVNLPSASVLAVLRREMVGRTEPPKAVAVLADPVFSIQDSRVNLQSKQNGREKQPMKTKDGSFYASAPRARSVEDADLADYGNKALQRLTFTRQEAEAIMAATPPGQGMEALGFAASRSTAMNPNLAQYRIVHFAAHGVLDSKHPELSGLVLSLVNSRGEPQNGFLDLQDIYNLNLPVDMVVLSACETALGKEIRGEGLVGLTRGFMYAGASRVVASLWNVDDVATAELMRRFYKAILREGLPPASALRKAQVEMARQKRWSDPYYWAAFTIEGEWRPIHP
ncbi:MAG TPA: CHAT domain-containing tetratricopeptide repeat protein, partial [Candidatus Angelobacter sp.]|nr:CHAT domain-containing tetratricopeptide repeat protein [Candidatus Angelobacter sp.]